jgi:Protein of unknown function (DUF3108)
VKHDPPLPGPVALTRIPALAGFVRYAKAHVGAGVAFALFWLPGGIAHAQAKLTAHYSLTLAGIAIGEGDWIVEIAKDNYTARSSGQFSGIWRALLGSDLSSATRGSASKGNLVPTTYEANFASDDDTDEVTMTFRDGGVAEFKTKPAIPDAPDRIPVTAAQLRGAVDPLTAGLVSDPKARDVLAAASCQRTLPIFDGNHRFDMALSFKRMENIKTEKGYQGPAIVCAMAYRPIAGYSPSAFRVKYLQKNRDMEMWFAPIAGARMLAMIRISIPTIFGTAMLSATRFESAVQ